MWSVVGEIGHCTDVFYVSNEFESHTEKYKAERFVVWTDLTSLCIKPEGNHLPVQDENPLVIVAKEKSFENSYIKNFVLAQNLNVVW